MRVLTFACASDRMASRAILGKEDLPALNSCHIARDSGRHRENEIEAEQSEQHGRFAFSLASLDGYGANVAM
jgi:hypothetical protein